MKTIKVENMVSSKGITVATKLKEIIKEMQGTYKYRLTNAQSSEREYIRTCKKTARDSAIKYREEAKILKPYLDKLTSI